MSLPTILPNLKPHPFRVIAVTGTNGKTSTTHFIAQALKMAGFNSAVIGTLGNGLIGHLEPATHTTPDAIALEKIYENFTAQHVDFVSLEASSHGLVQNRLKNTDIFMGIFTNLTQDHLDYHKTWENYAAAKLKLFTDFNLKHAIINIDDPTGKLWAKTISAPTLTLSLNSRQADIYVSDIKIHSNYITGLVHTPWGNNQLLTTKLLGPFNLYNLLSVIAALGLLQIPLNNILDYISQLKPIPGRMEAFGGTAGKPLIIVDYSHTPDSLEKALQALQAHCPDTGKLWCVMGCGGDRDKLKRPIMGHIAETLADYVIITDDNPRTENSHTIIADIVAGITPAQQPAIIIEPNRARAISHAIQSAKSNDIILIAGKGHETYQEIGHEKIPFSDILEVKKLLCLE